MIFYILYLIFSPFTYPSEIDKTDKRFEFKGNRAFSKKYLSQLILNKFQDEKTEEEMVRVILEEYRRAGFLSTEVRTEVQKVKNKIITTFYINEGKRAIVSNIILLGVNSEITGVLLRKLKKGFFTEKSVQNNIRTILSYFEDNGYPFSVVKPKDFEINDNKIAYTLLIDLGPEVKIDRVIFQGNFFTKPEILEPVLNLGKDFSYSETRVKKRVQKLQGTGLFKILEHKIIEDDNRFNLEITLSEEKNNQIDGVIGYLPEEKEFSGFLSLALRNLFYTLRQGYLRWRKSPSRVDFSLEYKEPYFLKTNIGLGGAIAHQVRDTTYARTDLAVNSEFRIGEFVNLLFETGYERVVPGRVVFDRAETYWAGSGINWDTRDYPQNPQSGQFLQFQTKIGNRMIGNQRPKLINQTFLNWEFIIPIIRPLNFALLGGFANLYTPLINIYDRLYLGGAKNLRGFREDQFASTRIAWLQKELRLSFSQGRFFLFNDVGVYQDLDTKRYIFQDGYGLGLRGETKLGVLGIDYGIPYKENLLNGKIHLRFLTRF